MRAFAMVLLTAFLLLGCSHTKTVNLLAMKWQVGQHQDCVYGSGNLFCIPANSAHIGGWPIKGIQDKDGKPIPRSEAIFEHSVVLTRRFESALSKSYRDKDDETGTYDIKFSADPADYSIWDCVKTGQSSPAISCSLTRKASGQKDTQLIAEKEEELRLDSMLKSLSIEQLETKCGKPSETNSDMSSRSLIYASSSGLPIAFSFETYHKGEPMALEGARSQEKKDPDQARKISWRASADSIMGMMEAASLVKEMPCLKK